MPRRQQDEFDLGSDLSRALPPKSGSPGPTGLSLSASVDKPLSPAQVEFNKRMRALEKQRAAHDRERAKLDKELQICIKEIMPLLEAVNRAELALILAAASAHEAVKLTKKRRMWLGDLISGKASDLLMDPVGVTGDDLVILEALVEKLGPCKLQQEQEELEREEFDDLRGMVEAMARSAGVDLDLSDLDLHGDPVEFERKLRERFDAAYAGVDPSHPQPGSTPPKRKPSKAAIERERLKQEMEETKNRDFKSLYKQLAKVLHPDLESDPELKAHKQQWMARLTNARDNGDLRDMLAIEMEWLGEEAAHLAQAGEDKLRVYCMVLKEQLAELKEQTRMLACEPQYLPLSRFRGPLGSHRHPHLVKLELLDEASRIKQMTIVLQTGGDPAIRMIQKWADEHARSYRY